MARDIAEWVGKTPDAAIPPRVQLRVFERFKGICPMCTRELVLGQWDCDHIRALVNGGEHREYNLRPLCRVPCHSQKTKDDVAIKSRSAGIRKREAGIKKPSKFACSRNSKWKRKISGEVVLR